jgi:starch synthase
MTNLPWQFFKPDGLEFYGQMNLMKAGIMFSDRLTTVSPRYAREIQTPEFGFGLESPLKTRADRLHGICNGIDPDEWNPARDPHIAQHYTPNNLEGKRRCKAELLSLFNLEGGEELPLIGMISRLTEQKGIDIIAEVLDQLVKDPVRLVVLGRGEARYERFWQDAAKRCRRSIGCRLAYDVSLAHKIEAGADMFLMPSKFEPCGLNQMYSLRYGTIPLVRATGGLDDTIEEFDPRTGQGTGFKFADYSGVALERKVKEALTVYANKTLWRQVQENAMTHRFSWSDAARQYLDIYQKD